MTVNFFLNNSTTYRDRRLRGTAIVSGLLSFYAACAVGALINVRLAEFARNAGVPWCWAECGGCELIPLR
jgi:dolichol-phosphate mannosyltransferase